MIQFVIPLGPQRVSLFQDEFYFTPLHNTGGLLSQQEQLVYIAQLICCPTTGHPDTTDPRIFLAHCKSDNEKNLDSPTFYEAVHGPNATEYREAMRIEIAALEKQNTWISTLRPTHHRVLKSTWVFKLKRLPDGTPYRYKAQFCVRGDLQWISSKPTLQWCSGQQYACY
jgi:hypothetical protein